MPPDILIPNSSIKSSTGGPMSIDKMEVSAVTIPTVDMKDFEGKFSYSSSVAKDVQVEMTLSVCSTFTGCVTVCWPICCVGVSGGIEISSYTQTNCLGDVAMDGGSFCMTVPDATFGPFSMTIPPVKNTTVAKIDVTDICMKCTEVPLPSPLGIVFGDSFPVPNPMGPVDVYVKQTTMADMDSTGIAIPPASMKNIKALNIKIPSVTTKGMSVTSVTPVSVSMSMPLYDDGSPMGSHVHTSGCANNSRIETDMTLNISSVTMNIKGGIEFKCIQGTVTTSSADAGAFSMDLNLKGVKIKGLKMLGMEMPELEVQL
jgi:hypothetical protein